MGSDCTLCADLSGPNAYICSACAARLQQPRGCAEVRAKALRDAADCIRGMMKAGYTSATDALEDAVNAIEGMK